MIVYLLMIVFSGIFVYLAQRSFKKQHKLQGIIFSVIAILIPSIIAGCRSVNIGTDLKVYASYMHYVSVNFSFSRLIEIFGSGDILYSLLTFIIGKVSPSFNFFLFVVQLINCTLIYIAVYKNRKSSSMVVSYLIFLLALYFRQLNLMRQGIALSFVICSFAYFKNSEKIKSIVLLIIGGLFHVTAFLAIPVFLLYKIFTSKNKKHISVALICIYSLLIFLLVFFKPIFNFILELNILPSKYSIEYFSRYIKYGFNIDKVGTVFRLFWCVIIVLLNSINKKLPDNKKIVNYNFFMHLSIIDFILWNFNIHFEYIDRVSFYYGFIYMIFFLPSLYKMFKRTLFNRGLTYYIIIAMFIIHWLLRFVYQNAGQVYPYIFSLRGYY